MARLGGIDTQYFDDSGDPLGFGRLYCYETGTYTPKGTFHDSGLTVPNKWPIVLDAIGVPPDVFFSGTARFILTDSNDTVLRELDPVTDNEFQTGDTIILRLGDIDSQFFDQNGDILANGKLYVYENGTSTPKATYSDNALTTPNSWPVVLDSVGFLGDVFFEGKARLVLTDQHGVQQREMDDVDTFDISYLPGFIVQCPDSVVVAVGFDVSFCVYVDGLTEDFTYQWYQDLTLLVGETGPCLLKTIVEADGGTTVWVTVTDGASTEQCASALITIDDTPCVWTPPVDNIVAEVLWEETEEIIDDEGIAYYKDNIFTEGDRIWLRRGGFSGKCKFSDDFGVTWQDRTLPPTLNAPSISDPQRNYQVPSMFQVRNGVIYADMREYEGNAANTGSWIYRVSWDFNTWTVDADAGYIASGIYNGRYNRRGMYINSNSELTHIGRQVSGSNNVYIARYSSFDGGSTVGSLLNSTTGANNQDAYDLLPFNGQLMYLRTDGAGLNLWRIMLANGSCSSEVSYAPTNFFTSSLLASNGIDTAITTLQTSMTFLKWREDQTLAPTTYAMPSYTLPAHPLGTFGSNKNFAFAKTHWFCMGGRVANVNWPTWYCTDATGATAAEVFTAGPTLILPSTGAGGTGTATPAYSLVKAKGDWWIGMYKKQADTKLMYFKFQYGTTTGTCEE